ncbi:MAG: dNTP triphosphohydrolase [Bryobacterales bacterium]|nr:dNTP triphosphohydrolase [Bryobacterales bacterium]
MHYREQRYISEERKDYRSPAQIDRDRILYSTAFARLAEVTQVVTADQGHVFHNRLTHSLKVGQLARRMAEKILREQAKEAEEHGGLDPDVAEAAGLAHDLGHPPFGHIAEETLDELLRTQGVQDGFEGNAQSFRILTKIAVSDAMSSPSQKSIPGLNLTRGTLNAVLKYPWLHGQNDAKKNKWGAYFDEQEVFDWVRIRQPFPPGVKSIEAELMDWADDITFAVHDLIDFFRAGQIPLERLGDPGGLAEREAFFEEVFTRCPELLGRRSLFEDSFENILTLFYMDRRYTGSREQRRHIWQFSTVLISRFVEAIKLRTDHTSPVMIEEFARDEVRVLKELTWHYVIVHNDLATGQHGQQRVIRELFRIFLGAAERKRDWKLFPLSLREQLAGAADDSRLLVRIVTDHIAGMTEKEAISQFRTLTGAA